MPVQVSLQATDAPGSVLRFHADSLPEGASLSGDGVFQWVPAVDQVGPVYVPFEVADDGKGFDVARERAEKASAGHLGLVGVEERARQANGTFTLASEPGKGTRATVALAI